MLVKLFGLSLVFMVFLGCVGDQANRQDVSQPPISVPINVSPAAPPDVNKADLNQLRSETVASNNAAQQSISGLGANIAKVAEKMSGVEGDVSAVKASITASMQTVATAVADFRATLTTNASAIANLKAELKAEFDTKIAAQADVHANAVAALKSQIETQAQTISAGRDANTQTIQFTKEMQQTLEAGYKAQLAEIKSAFYAIIAIVHIFAGLIIGLQHGSVKHERKRSDQAAAHLQTLTKTIEEKSP